MMTNDEIRALVGELEYWCEADGMRSAIHYLANSKRAIETLLARQDDLAKHAHPYVLATDYAALEAERDEWKRRCEAKERLESAGYTEDEQGRAFDLNAVKCPYCGDSTPLTEEGGCPEEVIRNFDWPSGNAECRNCDKTFYYEIEGCAITDSMTMEYDGTPIAEGRDNG